MSDHGLAWTVIRHNPIMFTTGKKQSQPSGGWFYSLHRDGAKGWILRQKGSRVELAGDWSWPLAVRKWNELRSRL